MQASLLKKECGQGTSQIRKAISEIVLGGRLQFFQIFGPLPLACKFTQSPLTRLLAMCAFEGICTIRYLYQIDIKDFAPKCVLLALLSIQGDQSGGEPGLG